MVYQIIYYVPESSLEKTKKALFSVGAGKIGNYDSCAWQILGQGQFRPLKGSEPHSGVQGEVSREPEFKVELVCDDRILKSAISALVESHPYETPAYFVFESVEVSGSS